MATGKFEVVNESFDGITDALNQIKEEVLHTTTINGTNHNDTITLTDAIGTGHEGDYLVCTSAIGYFQNKRVYIRGVNGNDVYVPLGDSGNCGFTDTCDVKIVKRQVEYLNHNKEYYEYSLDEVRPYKVWFWDSGEGFASFGPKDIWPGNTEGIGGLISYTASGAFIGDRGLTLEVFNNTDYASVEISASHDSIKPRYGKISMYIKTDMTNFINIICGDNEYGPIRFLAQDTDPYGISSTNYIVSENSGVTWHDTGIAYKVDEWFKLEFEILENETNVKINGTVTNTFYISCDVCTGFRAIINNNLAVGKYMHIDEFSIILYQKEAYFETTDITPSDMVSRWESITGILSGITADTEKIKVSAYNAVTDLVIPQAQDMIMKDGTTIDLTSIPQNIQSIYLRFTFYSLGTTDYPVLKEWKLTYSLAPIVDYLKITENSGEVHKLISPNAIIETETTALVKFQTGVTENTYEISDYFYDYGDGKNSGWISSDYMAYVFSKANENKEGYYPCVIARDEYERESCSIYKSSLDEYIPIDSVTNETTFEVVGDYSAYDDVMYRIRMTSGVKKGNIYHIESVTFNNPNTVFVVDDCYTIQTDGIVASDKFEIILIRNYNLGAYDTGGDCDGTNILWEVDSYKVKPTAILDMIPNVIKEAEYATLMLDRSFTPNYTESIGTDGCDFDFGEGNGYEGWQTAQTISHQYSNPGTFTIKGKVKDTALTGAAVTSNEVSIDVIVLSKESYGEPLPADCLDVFEGGTYDGVAYNAIQHAPSSFTRDFDAEIGEQKGITGYSFHMGVNRKSQRFTMKGKFISGASNNWGEDDFKVWMKIWKNNVIIKFRWKNMNYLGVEGWDRQYFYGMVEYISIENGDEPLTYEYTINLVYMDIDDTYEIYD